MSLIFNGGILKTTQPPYVQNMVKKLCHHDLPKLYHHVIGRNIYFKKHSI
jgi:hypothetical protein